MVMAVALFYERHCMESIQCIKYVKEIFTFTSFVAISYNFFSWIENKQLNSENKEYSKNKTWLINHLSNFVK